MRALLYQRAASCYERAAADVEAARCWEAAGRPDEAARLHEAARRWEDAARCWSTAKSRHHAARCFLRAARIPDAVEALIDAGEMLEAAWLLADRLGHTARASRLIVKATRSHRADELAAELIMARCALSRGRDDARARRTLRRTIRELPHLEQGAGQWRAARWAVELADHLDRPDLAALTHAAAVRGGVPDATLSWESWALRRLGDAGGIPQNEETIA